MQCGDLAATLLSLLFLMLLFDLEKPLALLAVEAAAVNCGTVSARQVAGTCLKGQAAGKGPAHRRESAYSVQDSGNNEQQCNLSRQAGSNLRSKLTEVWTRDRRRL